MPNYININTTTMKDIFYHNDEYILRAHEYMESWNYLEAKKLLVKLLEDEPDHGPAHFLLGKIYSFQLHDNGTALYHYREALAHCPILIDAYYYLICLYIDRGDYEKALQVCHQALDQPGIAEDFIWYYQAQALEKSGHFIDALDFYEKALLHSIDDETVRQCEDGMARVNKKREFQQRQKVVYWSSHVAVV